MACDVDLEKFLELIGHDGSERKWPEEREPLCRRAFHIQECILAAHKLGNSCTPFEFYPAAGINAAKYYMLEHKDLILKIMKGKSGIMLGKGLVHNHAVAWDGEQILDPSQGVYGLDDPRFIPNTFMLICFQP